MMNKRTKNSELSKTGPISTTRISGVGLFLAIIIYLAAAWGAIQMSNSNLSSDTTRLYVIVLILIGTYIMLAIKIASQWEKAVVLRLGKFHGLKGPGLFWIIPIVDTIANWIDNRVMVTPFSAEKTRVAIAWAAQTALREIIGQMDLADILVGRARMDADLQKIIDERTTPWGITVQSVEIRDVIIPQDLEATMSRRAQAERERQARVILGESEKQIAESFSEASKAYVDNPTALHLRAMNMLFEGLKENGAMVIVPSSAVDTMNLGGLSGMISLGLSQSKKGDNPANE
jgi:regulator of protease activity HflC (stomatin/prohibitin superfamily)